MTGLYILLAVVFVTLVWAVATYNVLVRLKQHCRESWSGIDTELQRRYNLIPNLVETVKGYAEHERDVLERLMQARNAAVASTGSPDSQARDENFLVGALRQVFAVAESYPELKASSNFLHLQDELANTENRIQAARRFYNANVRDLNTRISVFPSNLIAGMFSVTKEEFFEIETAAAREAPQTDFHTPAQ